MIVRLDEEGAILQHIHQQVAGSIHHCTHSPALQPCQQALVGVLRQALGDAACEDQDIVFSQLIQLCFQLLHGTFRDIRACAVQLGLLPGLDLHIDAGHAFFQMHKVRSEPLCCQTSLQPRSGLTGHKAQRHALAAQLCQYAGHVDALAAQHAVLAVCAVDFAHLQRCVQTHHIVDCGIECYCIDHCSVSFTSVICLYFGLGQRLVRMAPSCRSAMTAG